MLQKKNEGILFSAEIRVVGSYTDRLLRPHCLRRTSYPLLLNYLKTQQCYLDFAEIVSFKTLRVSIGEIHAKHIQWGVQK